MLFSIFIFLNFLGSGKSNQKNICLNQRHYLNKFKKRKYKKQKEPKQRSIRSKIDLGTE